MIIIILILEVDCMARVSMLTVIPIGLAKELCTQRRVKEYNSLPQLNKRIHNAIREYMSENVGYSDLPMACFGKPENGTLDSVESVTNILPINSKESLLFLLEMPDDMIVSVGFDDLLNASHDADACNDEEELEYILEDFKDLLCTGVTDDAKNRMIFIPFLDLSRCRFFAKLDDTFGTEELVLPGIERMDIRKLTSFR